MMRLHTTLRGISGSVALCLSIPLPVHPQTLGPSPVHWSAGPVAVTHGAKRFQVSLHAAIDPGWHLYALQQPGAFPLATEIALQKDDTAELLRVEQAKPRHAVDPESHVVTNYFVKDATFTLRLKRNPAVERSTQPLHVLVRYQACNDRLCLPPKNEMVPVLPQGAVITP